MVEQPQLAVEFDAVHAELKQRLRGGKRILENLDKGEITIEKAMALLQES